MRTNSNPETTITIEKIHPHISNLLPIPLDEENTEETITRLSILQKETEARLDFYLCQYKTKDILRIKYFINIPCNLDCSYNIDEKIDSHLFKNKDIILNVCDSNPDIKRSSIKKEIYIQGQKKQIQYIQIKPCSKKTDNRTRYDEVFIHAIETIAKLNLIYLPNDIMVKILKFYQLEYVALNKALNEGKHKSALQLVNEIAKQIDFNNPSPHSWGIVQLFEKVCDANPTENTCTITAAQIKICEAITNDKNHAHHTEATSFSIDRIEALLSYQKDGLFELTEQEIDQYANQKLDLLFNSNNPNHKIESGLRFSERCGFPLGSGLTDVSYNIETTP